LPNDKFQVDCSDSPPPRRRKNEKKKRRNEKKKTEGKKIEIWVPGPEQQYPEKIPFG